jgi:hypothetical protein
VFFFVFSRVWQDCSSQVVFFGEVAEPSCRRQDDFGTSFHFFHLILEARSTLHRRLLTDTRPPAAFSVVFHPCRRKIRSCRSPETGTWCPRATFFWPISAASGHAASDLRLGGTGRTRAAFRLRGPFPPLSAACFGWFVLHCRVFFFSFFLGHSLLVLGSNFMGIFVG